MNFKTIIWDADGVLIKSKYRFSEKLESEFGIDKKKTLPFFLGVFRECGIGKADLKEELAKVIDDWGWKGTVDELLYFWLTEGTKIDEDVFAVAKDLYGSGLQAFMATDNEKYRGERLRELFEGKVVDRVFLSGELGCRKNTVMFWEKMYGAIEHMSKKGLIEKGEILYIDDDQNDIDMAREFGFVSHLYGDDLDELKKRVVNVNTAQT